MMAAHERVTDPSGPLHTARHHEAYALGASLAHLVMAPTLLEELQYEGGGAWLIQLLLRGWLHKALMLHGACSDLADVIVELMALDPSERLVDLSMAAQRMQRVKQRQLQQQGQCQISVLECLA